MSYLTDQDPIPGDAASCDAVELVVVPPAKDLGGFTVRRALPAARRQMVGPFIFLDQMGPAVFDAGQGIDVRPHPHIGLSTLTYLVEGRIRHRDSLGSDQVIRPGEVNLMTAGRGIVHSERTLADDLRRDGRRMFGLQCWLALPKARERTEAAFVHVAGDDLPRISGPGVDVRLVAGALFGARSTLATASATLFADVALAPGASIPIDAAAEERAIYTLSGEIRIGPDTFEAGRLLVLRPGETPTVEAVGEARFAVLGGDAMDGPRHIWWNFVASDRGLIEAARADWRARRFDVVPGDAEEFIPLPG